MFREAIDCGGFWITWTVLVSLVALFFSLPRVGAEPSSIKIGVSTALTGPSATYGLDIRDALLFANQKLGKGHYQLIFEDDRCVSRDAVGIAHKLINVDKVKYVLGFACSGSAIAATPLYEKGGIITILASTSSPRLPRISKEGKFIFRTFPNITSGIRLLVNYISNKHKVFGIISEETEYSQDLKQLLLNAGKNSAVEQFSVEDFTPDLSDFAPIVVRMKARHVDGLLINAQSEASYHAVLKRIREAKWDIPLYGVFWPGSPSLLSNARGELEGITYIDTPPLNSILTEDGAKIYEEYKLLYGKPRSIEATFATAFEAFHALTAAIESGEDVRRVLNEHRFVGLFGPYQFDKAGQIVGISLVLKVIRNGQPLLLAFEDEDNF